MKEKFEIDKQDADRLLMMLQEAHYQAAINNASISQTVFLNAVHGSGNPMSAVAAGLLSTGAMHAPVTEVRELIQQMLSDTGQFSSILSHMVKVGGKIPGLGNSFFKDSIDPAFGPVNDYLRQVHMDNDLGLTYVDSYASIANEIIKHYKESKAVNEEQMELIKRDYKPLFPNAALITSAVCEFLGGVRFIENWFFVSGRSRGWLEMASRIKTI